MNKLFTYLAIMIIGTLITSDAFAQAPEKMSYQAVIRDADGKLVTNTKVGIRIRIQKLIIGMPPSHQDVYVETHSVYKTNENGLLTLMIGTGKVVMGNFADINWSDGTYNLKTETDPEGGTNYNVTGSSPILSVPYALHAKNVKTYKVGDFAQGGIVFWVDETGQHGLVCAKKDQSDGAHWYAGEYGVTLATGDGPYAGKANTAIIITAQIAFGNIFQYPFAARICNELQITENNKTYGDWYLPSKEELNLMYQNRAIIEETAIANGGKGFAGMYWSSTEYDAENAWWQSWHNGWQVKNNKQLHKSVRAIRAF